jgi:hypothetical protein
MAEIRDPIHGFIFFDERERALIDSPPVQRLKYVHQLGTGYLIYPGATHSRFEHALGTMELAGRAFDAICRNSADLAPRVFGDGDGQKRWRATVRVAGLLHDVGHAPFSHAADSLFTGSVMSHEEMTRQLVHSDKLADIIASKGNFRLDPREVAFVASGLGTPETEAELVCKELITGDLGVDRMDYLRRDSHMCGVSYGLYDLPRLVETLMLAETASGAHGLALEHGGMHAAEGLLTARYFMFSQVYYHDIRVVYDEHLLRFLRRHLPDGRYPDDVSAYQGWDDVRVLSLLREQRDDPDARAILSREHFRRVHEFARNDLGSDLSFADRIRERLESEFGEDIIVGDSQKSTRSLSSGDVLVVDRDTGRQDDILVWSTTLDSFKPIWFLRIYCAAATRTSVLNVIKEFSGQSQASSEAV